MTLADRCADVMVLGAGSQLLSFSMKTLPFPPEKVNVWLESLFPSQEPTNAVALDHPDRLYKHTRGGSSPLPPAGAKPASPGASTGCKQKENDTCVESFDSKHQGMFARGCPDCPPRWNSPPPRRLGGKNLECVPEDVSPASPLFCPLHLIASKK